MLLLRNHAYDYGIDVHKIRVEVMDLCIIALIKIN